MHSINRVFLVLITGITRALTVGIPGHYNVVPPSYKLVYNPQ